METSEYYETNKPAICCDNKSCAARRPDITVSVNWLRFEWWLNHVWASPGPPAPNSPVKMISAPLHTKHRGRLLAPLILWVFETNINLLNSDRYLLWDRQIFSVPTVGGSRPVRVPDWLHPKLSRYAVSAVLTVPRPVCVLLRHWTLRSPSSSHSWVLAQCACTLNGFLEFLKHYC